MLVLPKRPWGHRQQSSPAGEPTIAANHQSLLYNSGVVQHPCCISRLLYMLSPSSAHCLSTAKSPNGHNKALARRVSGFGLAVTDGEARQ